MEARSADWHVQRKLGIGASEVAAVAGLSPFAKPIDVWSQKVGLAEPSEETARMRWGTLLEPVVAQEAERELGIPFRRLSRAVHYHDWPILFAHLDRTSAEAILEVKTSMTLRGWGETGSSDVPDHVALQVQAQLACSGKETAYVAALLGYSDFRTYRLTRDRDLFEESVLPILREFWALVETATPPAPDGSDGYGAYLRRRYPRDDRESRTATPEEQLTAGRLIEWRKQRAEAEEREAEFVQLLQSGMAETSRLDGPGWRVTWKQSKDTERTNWTAVASAYRRLLMATDAPPDFEAIEGIHTDTRPGARPFRLTLTEEEGE